MLALFRMRNINLILSILFFTFAVAKSFSYQIRSPGVDFYVPWGLSQINNNNPHLQGLVYSDNTSQQKLFEHILVRSLNENIESNQVTLSYWIRSIKENEKIPSHTPVNVFTGTPAFYSLFLLVKNLSFADALIFYQVFSTLALILACYLFSIRYNLTKLSFLLVTGLILFAFLPLYSEYAVANFNRIQVAVLACLYFLSTSKLTQIKILLISIIATFFLMVKPNTLFLVLAILMPLLCFKRFRLILFCGNLLGIALAVASSMLMFQDINVWEIWFDQAFSTSKLTYIINDNGNFSLLPKIQSNTIFIVIFSISTLIVIANWLIKCFYSSLEIKDKITSTLEQASALTCLLAPLVWYHYYLILIIPLFGFARKIQENIVFNRDFFLIFSILAWLFLFIHPYLNITIELKQLFCQLACLLLFTSSLFNFKRKEKVFR